ncbi:endonuclease/exonuclease/phosphatase family protein [Pelagovum pacificum]|uniref:Endonuclease/exonuclease/phosphatase family protein n=1 Tax=Pelagovum pacificum TaxID=2588711 RepID=A0A5C5GAF6_9RHOB|nr:endonuclease/exonuclease/phosphatase family protein [Pelagovum pacificum]QQA45089.1 endonuclease/exonuclease/phosphatase family protein [Pelagovum pacificum]TNY30537.1 endonuclease/exonuclease/phosphatase family protein [Pelagovum pacificum]
MTAEHPEHVPTGPRLTQGRIWLERGIGLLLFMLASALWLGVYAQEIGDDNQLFGTLARILDSMRPVLLLLSLCLSGLLLALGLRWIGLAGLVLTVLAIGALVLDYRSRVAPAGEETDLTVLWFNVLGSNPIGPDALEQALRDSGADVIALAEAGPAREMAARLADLYPHHIGCDPGCGTLVLSRYPVEDTMLRPMEGGADRLIRFTLTVGARPIDMLAVHMGKPWYLSVSQSETWRLNRIVANLVDRGRPLIVMGDLNAAPWSRRLQRLEERRGLAHARWPVATWPAALGPLAVPIDHVLLGEGAAFTGLEAWGGDLGSNHRGLIARIDLDV